MSGAPLRLGLVGCGRLAEIGYLPALRGCADVELVAVADPDPTRRGAVAGLAPTSVRAFDTAAAMLEGVHLDGVVLASPASAHLDDARLAAGAGLAVLVEKPPAPDLAGARELASLSPAPWIGFNRRFDPAARAARARVPAEGACWLALTVTYRRRSWGAHVVRDDTLADLGPHLVDWARWIGGSGALAVAAEHLTADRARVRLDLERGSAVLHAAADGIHRERIEVRDGSGRLLARHHAGGVVGAVRGRLRRGPHPLVSSLTAQLRAFARAARDGVHPVLATAEDGCAVMGVIDAARDSARQGGRPVDVPQAVEP